MACWLVKSEPGVWSWDDQVAAGTTPWDGVKNAQALGNMRAMQVGDEAFFYHSGKERRIVGLVGIVRAFYPDPEDAKSGLVDMQALRPLPRAVSLAEVKAEPALAGIALVRQSRLSAMPIPEEARELLMKMAGL